ncbi:MAG: HD domain-containing protein [Bacteroidales bacterium]|nr:HD domain-containing protein [Bacteroidales bacterium]
MAHQFITQAEQKYRELLKGECKRIFSGMNMPSHDHLHHERVWENAALLLGRLYDTGIVNDPVLAEKAIIAAFFHDTGLTVNPGPDHGRQSRQFCRAFLQTAGITGSDRQEILDAVEMHDNKDYKGRSDPSSLAAILSVADDMDAFGQAGIARYEEIYTMRGIPASEMPGLIIPNVRSRFRHLESTYNMFPDLVREMQAGAETVINHFNNKAR